MSGITLSDLSDVIRWNRLTQFNSDDVIRFPGNICADETTLTETRDKSHVTREFEKYFDGIFIHSNINEYHQALVSDLWSLLLNFFEGNLDFPKIKKLF